MARGSSLCIKHMYAGYLPVAFVRTMSPFYRRCVTRHACSLRVPKVLLTKRDLSGHQAENFRDTMHELMKMDIVPILNGNDVVAGPPETSADLEGVSLSIHLCGLLLLE